MAPKLVGYPLVGLLAAGSMIVAVFLAGACAARRKSRYTASRKWRPSLPHDGLDCDFEL